MKRFLTSTCLFVILGFSAADCQQSYFYSSIKVPIADYIGYLINNNNSNTEARTDGALFDFGYGMDITENLIVETGFEAFFFNPLYRKHYFSDDPKSGYTELSIVNRGFTLQLRPVFKIDVDEQAKFRVACALNFQQLFSSGNYFLKNDGQNFTAVADVQSSASSKSKFNLVLQPLVGMDFMLTDNFGLGFDVAYVCVNWNKSLENMHFDSGQNIVIPDHKTSNVFLAGRIIF